MNLEAFCRVLPLLVEMCKRLLLTPCKSLSEKNHFLERENGLLAAAKNLISDGYFALQKTCSFDLIYMPIYRKNYPLLEPYQGRPLNGLLVGLGVHPWPPKIPPPVCPSPRPSISQSGPYIGPDSPPSLTPRRSRSPSRVGRALGHVPRVEGTWGVSWAGRLALVRAWVSRVT